MLVSLVKQRVSVSEPPFVWVRGNVCDSSLASWKTRCQLPVGYNCTFLLAFTAEALMRRDRILLKGWVTLGINIMLKGYVYRQHLYTVTQRNGTSRTLLLEVLHIKNFVAD